MKNNRRICLKLGSAFLCIGFFLMAIESRGAEVDLLAHFEKQMEVRQQAKLRTYPGGADEGVLEVQEEIAPFVQKEISVLEDPGQQEASEF